MLEEILKYQEIESNLISAENELSKSKERELASKMGDALKDDHSKVISLEKNAETVNARYQKAIEKFEQYSKKLEALEKEMQVVDETKLDLYEKAYKDFSAISNGLEKEIAQIYSEIQQINHSYEEVIAKSKSDRDKFDKFKAAYSKQKEEKEPVIEKLKKDLEKQKKKVDEKLFKLYHQKREGKIFPIFVKLNKTKCGGCRMEISASKLGLVKTNEFKVVECENCGRFNFDE